MGNIFLEKAKCGGETSPRVFYQIIKIEHISESTVWNLIKLDFIVCPRQGLPKEIKIMVLTTCIYLI